MIIHQYFNINTISYMYSYSRMLHKNYILNLHEYLYLKQISNNVITVS